MKLFFHIGEVLLLFFVILVFFSCHGVQDIPFPKELSEYAQPQTVPLELTDPQPLHWDTVGHRQLKPTVFPLDFSKMKAMLYDPDGFKPIAPVPTNSTFNYEKLPVTSFMHKKDEPVNCY